jgi:hypothetical protein
MDMICRGIADKSRQDEDLSKEVNPACDRAANAFTSMPEMSEMRKVP